MNIAPMHNPNGNSTVRPTSDIDDPTWIRIQDDNTAIVLDDAEYFVSNLMYLNPLYPDGSGFSWDIPVLYKRKDDPDDTAVQLQTVTQTFNISPPYSTVTKGDAHEP